MQADASSIYVVNVDNGATAEEQEAHFHGCGSVDCVTTVCDKFSGLAKGFAYIELLDKESVRASLALDDSLFRGRQTKVAKALSSSWPSSSHCSTAQETTDASSPSKSSLQTAARKRPALL
ncbi:hypothetical protein U0070_009144 [Myodes glareolus]|uniref:RRM domain-containing protein n=1 Tax=Myodes glareolus TaxID=447135 RepID=A0AAW0HBW0_MYOGA